MMSKRESYTKFYLKAFLEAYFLGTKFCDINSAWSLNKDKSPKQNSDLYKYFGWKLINLRLFAIFVYIQSKHVFLEIINKKHYTYISYEFRYFTIFPFIFQKLFKKKCIIEIYHFLYGSRHCCCFFCFCYCCCCFLSSLSVHTFSLDTLLYSFMFVIKKCYFHSTTSKNTMTTIFW